MAKQRFYDTHPNVGKGFDRNVYNSFYYQFFCKDMEEYRAAVTGGLFPEQAVDTKKVLEQHFGIEL